MLENWTIIKNEIFKETRTVVNGRFIRDHSEIIETLKDFLLFPLNNPQLHLDGLETRVLNAMDKILVEGLPKKDNHAYFLEIAKIEPLLRKLLYIVDQPLFNTLSQAKKGLHAFINALNLNPANVNLGASDPSLYTNDANFIDQIIIVYNLRNIESHQCAEWTNAEMHSKIQSILAVQLFIINKFFIEIHQIIDPYFSKAEKDFTNYLKAIRSHFEDKMKRFIHILGKEDLKLSEPSAVEVRSATIKDGDQIERKGTIQDLRNKEIPEKRMIIWGDAGMGKTTSMEYLSYVDAKAKLADENAPIPVYIPLGLLTDKLVSIKQTLFNKLEIDAEYGEKLLNSDKLNLYLDAINEIPKDENYSLRTLRYKEIQNLLNTYREPFIILSNRPQELNEFKTIPVFSLQKMDIDQIKEFISKNLEQFPELIVKVTDAILADPRLLSIVKTPLMLSRFIEIVRTEGEIPKSEGEIIHHFIESLYRREKEEKKDANFDLKKISRLLRHLGYMSLEKYGTNSGMTEDEVLNDFVATKTKYGFEIDTVYVIEVVTQLNILEKNDGLYTFSHQAYQDYFHSQEERALVNV